MNGKLEKVKTWAMEHKAISAFIVIFALLFIVSQCT